jgi:hypothetical protein
MYHIGILLEASTDLVTIRVKSSATDEDIKDLKAPFSGFPASYWR